MPWTATETAQAAADRTIAYIGAGAAGTICANCLKDNALAAALRRQGHDVVLLPAYTPLLTDERDVSERRVVFSGINLYLQSKYAFFRSSGLFDRILDHPGLLRWASGLAVDTDPAKLGAMTRDTFLGMRGPYRRELEKLVTVLREIRPAIVHLTNSMLACMAEPIKRHFGVPVVCSLSGEAEFLAGLSEPYRSACQELLREDARHIDWFIGSCDDQVRSMARILNNIADRTSTILPGITLDGYRDRPRQRRDRFVVGFLARIAETKGLETLAEAIEQLRRRQPRLPVDLRVAGWRNTRTQKYVDRLRERFGFTDRGYLSREDKIGFLGGIDAFSVPTCYPAAKGLYVLEALAAEVPVVQPRIGIFPEIIAATGGGLLCEPHDSSELATKLEQLATDPEAASAMGKRGRAAIIDRFHVDRMASDTYRIYEHLWGSVPPGRP